VDEYKMRAMIEEILERAGYYIFDEGLMKELVDIAKKYTEIPEANFLGKLEIRECGVIKHPEIKRSQKGEEYKGRPFIDNFDGERDLY